MSRRLYRRYLKRWLDLSLVVGLLPLWLPVLAVVALTVRATLGTPCLFRQRRPGVNGRPFELYKFRTMTDRRDARGELLGDRHRMTRVGRFLRATSLDELPELWNVLRGDMSLVGPRPLLMSYLERYTPEQNRRHEVRPGLTGWAQIHGRNDVPWEERFRLDVWYVDHHGFLLDARILAVTVGRILRPSGVNARGHATMPPFQGTATPSAPCSNNLGPEREFIVAGRVATGSQRRPIRVLGAGGHAKVVVRTLQEAGWEVVGIHDDYEPRWGQTLMGVPVLGPLSDLERHAGEAAVIAIGDCRVRQALSQRFDLDWKLVVHPRAIVDRTCRLGPGTVVMAGAVLQACCRVGSHVIINTGATVDHDGVVHDFAHLAPGVHLAGNVRVGSGAMMGIGSCAIPGTNIGRWTTVGAGAVVTRDLPRGVVAVGCPARVVGAVASSSGADRRKAS